MRTLILVTSLIALLMYVGFAAQQNGATPTGAPLQPQTALAPVRVPALTADGEPVQTPQPRRFAPLAFLTRKPASCAVPPATSANAGR
jgi:hypothetical protein